MPACPWSYPGLMRSEADNIVDYLKALPDDRRTALEAVREVIVANLPNGIVETINWGMISYEVPLAIAPNTYNGKPLSYAGLASQKRHMAVYLSGIYGDPTLRATFEERYRATGLRMDMGKSCVRFTRLQDLPLDLIGWAVSALTLQQFVDMHTRVRSARRTNASRRSAPNEPLQS
jgi:uncharacterized protein YdhG (YjbR/CyaY superfamily)